MNVTGGRALELVLALGVALLLLATPAADLLAFGLHEHIVVPERGSNLSEPSTAQEPLPSHHCELSVSAGNLVPVIELPIPELVAIDPPEQRASALSQPPFVLLAPPRA